ncbi:MAG: hypothetical protein K2I03_13245 [Lachnospiraceae bacterium]|nr:hypothetical protein [Lachnospiraceae bacterium]
MKRKKSKSCGKYLELLRGEVQNANQNGQDMNKLIIDFCRKLKSVQEIMDKFGFDGRTSF